MRYVFSPLTGKFDYVLAPAEILAGLLTVDGAGSGLDADLLDGLHAAAFAPAFTSGNLTASSPLAFNNTRQVIGGAAEVKLGVSVADRYLYSTALDTWTEGTITADARLLLADADVPRLSTVNTWTGAQTINVNSTTALLVEQDGVKDNVLVVDTTNGRVGVNTAPSVMFDIAGTGDDVIHQLTTISDTVGDSIQYVFRRARVGPANLVANDDIAQWEWKGWAGGAYRNASQLLVDITGISGSALTGRIVWQLGSSAGVLQFLRVDGNNGTVRFGSSASAADGHVHIEGVNNDQQLILQAFSTQTNALEQHQDSSKVVHNEFYVPYSTNVYTTIFNMQGSPYLDFKVLSDTYDAIFVDASADTLKLGVPVTIGSGAAGVDYTLTFDGETNDGVLTWMEDEDYFQFADVVKTAGRLRAVTTKTTTYTLTAADEVVVCNSTTAFTVTLPPATGSGRTYAVANVNTGVVTLEGDGADVINGDLNQTIDQWACIQVVDYDSGKWTII